MTVIAKLARNGKRECLSLRGSEPPARACHCEALSPSFAGIAPKLTFCYVLPYLLRIIIAVLEINGNFEHCLVGYSHKSGNPGKWIPDQVLSTPHKCLAAD